MVATALAPPQLRSDKELMFPPPLNVSSVIKIRGNYTVYTSNEIVNTSLYEGPFSNVLGLLKAIH